MNTWKIHELISLGYNCRNPWEAISQKNCVGIPRDISEGIRNQIFEEIPRSILEKIHNVFWKNL